VLEYWSVGVLEYWSIGVLEYWSVGVLETIDCGFRNAECGFIKGVLNPYP
jgi:hypothetical protein